MSVCLFVCLGASKAGQLLEDSSMRPFILEQQTLNSAKSLDRLELHEIQRTSSRFTEKEQMQILVANLR